MIEIILLTLIFIFIVTYRSNTGENFSKFFVSKVTKVYDKYAPYSYKEMRRKIKDLGMDYTPRQYITQIVLFAGFAGAVGYMYFYVSERRPNQYWFNR